SASTCAPTAGVGIDPSESGSCMQRNAVRPMHLGSRESLLRMLALIIAGLVVVGLAAEIIRFAIPDYEESRWWRTAVRLFDLNDENSIATWFQGLHLAFVG